MANTADMQTVRIVDIKNEIDKILADQYLDEKVKALVRPTIDLLIVNLRAKR